MNSTKKNTKTLELFHASLSDSELYHHGILGMKWGVRRYQNADGSLTAAGKQRYLKNPKADSYSSEKEFADNLTKKGRRRFVDKKTGELIQKGKDAFMALNEERLTRERPAKREVIEKSKLNFKERKSDFPGLPEQNDRYFEASLDGRALGNKNPNFNKPFVFLDVDYTDNVSGMKNTVSFFR